jgi:hypothetical protein
LTSRGFAPVSKDLSPIEVAVNAKRIQILPS